MEHTFLTTAAALALTAAAVVGAMAFSQSFAKEEPHLAAENPEVSVLEESEEMVLGTFEGKLALFVGKSPYPNRIFDFMVRTLPLEDQSRLAEGIKISSEEELELLLEDFMS